MGFFPFQTLVDLHLGIAGGVSTENGENKAAYDDVSYLNYVENSNYGNIPTALLSAGVQGKAKVDVFNLGFSLDLEQRYQNQNWNINDKSSTQSFQLTQTLVGVVVSLRPQQTWDVTANFYLGIPFLLTSKRSGGDEAGTYKLKAGRVYGARVMLYGLRSGTRSFGLGGDYVHSAFAIQNTSDSSHTFGWFSSTYIVRFETRWEIL